MASLHVRIVAVAAIAIGTGIALGVAGWLAPDRTAAFTGLMLASILASALAARPSALSDRSAPSLSFVADIAALLLLGPNAATLVALGGAITHALVESHRSQARGRGLLHVTIGVVAIQAAGAAHRAAGGTLGHFVWPWQGVPIAAAVVTYSVVQGVMTQVIVPFVTRQPLDRSWVARMLRHCPGHFIGAGVAVGL